MSILDISDEHILQLSDVQLRSLVALLCEAELIALGHSKAGVTWGGAQTATDGGLDVRVELTAGPFNPNGYVKRLVTGFQVKCSDMQPADIAKEMAPKGAVREVIKELIEGEGSYVIVSSKGSITDKPLRARRAAMKEVLGQLDPGGKLHLDFYDRKRMASWVSQHPGLVAWVRREIGAPLKGWQPYQAWSQGKVGTEEPYIADDSSRLVDARQSEQAPLLILEGIKRMREAVREPGSIVRLVGLSGTGKTRLVQALFDDQLDAGQALDSRSVLYTDFADEPEPRPEDVVVHLDAIRARCVVIVDNCPPSVHESLARKCSGSTYVSLLTVEYDVRDESAETAEVFFLQPASNEAIRRLIHARFPKLDAASVARVTEVSGGNARLALAIAKVAPRGGNLAVLPSTQLFERLFQQRGKEDTELLRVAMVCALVNSFDVQGPIEENPELVALANVAQIPAATLYARVADLSERHVIQARSRWRALLPQALAGWLASRAFKSFPLETIQAELFEKAPKRLFASFSRRLGDLHESAEAKELVKRWLQPDGWLGDPFGMDDNLWPILRNVAPVLPDAVLEALTRSYESQGATTAGRYKQGYCLPLLQALAFDEATFDQALDIMLKFAQTSKLRHDDSVVSLFQARLSNTMATPEMRRRRLLGMLNSSSEVIRALGMDCLKAMLRTHCRALEFPSFGARSRSFGYWPKDEKDLSSWFSSAIEVLKELAVRDGPLKQSAMFLAADCFKGLWRSKVGCQNALIACMTAIAGGGFWPQGWIAVRNATYAKSPIDEVPERLELERLEQLLRPNGSVDWALVYMHSVAYSDLDVVRECGGMSGNCLAQAHKEASVKVRELGVTLCKDGVVDRVMSDLFRRTSAWNNELGHGIAQGCDSLSQTWENLVSGFASLPEGDRSPRALSGFLYGALTRDANWVSHALDGAVLDVRTRAEYPELQVRGPHDEGCGKRMAQAVAAGFAVCGKFSEAWRLVIPNSQFAELTHLISRMPGGFLIAVYGLHLRFGTSSRTEAGVDEALLGCGRALLQQCSFLERDIGSTNGHEIAEMVKHCLSGRAHIQVAKTVASNVRAALETYDAAVIPAMDVIKALVRVQPLVALDEFFGEERVGPERWMGSIEDMEDSRMLLDEVSTEVLLEWASVEPDLRVPKLLAHLSAYMRDAASGKGVWTESFQKLVLLCAHPLAVYEAVEEQLVPNGYSGTFAARTALSRPLVTEMVDHINPKVADWARELLVQMEQSEAKSREWNTRENAFE